jgi:hypothetical protein
MSHEIHDFWIVVQADAKHPWLVLLYRRGHRNTSPTLSATWEAVAKDLAKLGLAGLIYF